MYISKHLYLDLDHPIISQMTGVKVAPTPMARFINASFFFVDIVGLSDAKNTTLRQARQIELLNEWIGSCDSFPDNEDLTFVLPTGDGMVIGFLREPELPLMLAIELHKKIRAYNLGKLPNDVVQVRIGIHSGPAFITKDIKGNNNLWGPGIIIARRVMDIGDGGHILLSSRVAEDLCQLSSEYERVLHPLERFNAKHNQQIRVYSAHDAEFGNPKLPKKIKSRIDEFLYSNVEVKLRLVDQKTMLVQHVRTYEIRNMNETPTSTLTHQIATDVERTFNDLHIKVYDERHLPLTISSIDLDTLNQKEFATTFPKPLSRGESTKYVLEYQVEEPERYFENMFFTNCKKFTLVFEYDKKKDKARKIRPQFYEVDTEKGKVLKSDIRPQTGSCGDFTTTKWTLHEVKKGRSVRIDW